MERTSLWIRRTAAEDKAYRLSGSQRHQHTIRRVLLDLRKDTLLFIKFWT